MDADTSLVWCVCNCVTFCEHTHFRAKVLSKVVWEKWAEARAALSQLKASPAGRQRVRASPRGRWWELTGTLAALQRPRCLRLVLSCYVPTSGTRADSEPQLPWKAGTQPAEALGHFFLQKKLSLLSHSLGI